MKKKVTLNITKVFIIYGNEEVELFAEAVEKSANHRTDQAKDDIMGLFE